MHDDADLAHLLQVLATLDTAAPTIEELAAASGLDREGYFDALELAEDDGLISAWHDSPDGPAIMLTPLAAERLNVTLEEVDGGVGRYLFRYRPEGDPPTKIVNKTLRGEVLASEASGKEMSPAEFYDVIPDPKALEPSEYADRIERLEANIPAEAKDFKLRLGDLIYKPVHLLGLRVAWGASVDVEGEPCIGCLGRPLALLEVCLRCDRSGLDGLLPEVTLKDLKQLERKAVLAGGVGAGKGGKDAGVPAVKAKRGRPEGVGSKRTKVVAGA